MTPERWQQIEKLYYAALEIDPAQRAAFLKGACAGDDALRKEVESLLTCWEPAQNFIETPALGGADRVPNDRTRSEIYSVKYCPKCQKVYPILERFCLDDGAILSLQDPYHLIGRTLVDKYRIDALVGVGGMGAVYSAHHLRINRQVAFKILLPHLALNSKQVISLFEQEAKTAGQLSHENIVDIKDAGRTADGIAYIAMEWLEGRTLSEELSIQAIPSFERTVNIIGQVTAALEAAHAKKVIHRDLKPSNVMLVRQPDGRERVKVLDFGIAKVLTETTAGQVSAPMGTPHYASPEQLRPGGHIDRRADIYSLGIMLYQMLTGTLPFNAPSTYELIQLQISAPPPPLRQLRPEIPVTVERLVLRILAKNPEQRPQSATEVSALLTAAFNFSNKPQTETLIDEPAGSAGSVVEKNPAIIISDISRAQVTKGFHLTDRIKHYKKSVLVTLIAFGIVLGATSYFPNRVKAINSLAVLPLTNKGGDSKTEYLSDGITESIIYSLSNLANLTVMARSTVSVYKGKEVDPRRAGQDLKVRAVLTGSIAQEGDILIIAAELVDAENGRQLWGERFRTKPMDILAVQEEIAKQISEKLQIKLTGEERRRLTKRYTENPEAYQLYLKGRHLMNQRDQQGFEQAVECYQQAIAKDQNYALAYAGLADAYFLGADDLLSWHEYLAKAEQATARALELDGTLAEAHVSSAMLKFWFHWDWVGAEKAFKQALELDPKYPTAHHWYAEYLIVKSRFDEGLREIKKAQELDQLSKAISTDVGWFFYYAHQYDKAILHLRETVNMFPDHAAAHIRLGQAYFMNGQMAEAMDEYLKTRSLSGDSPERVAELKKICEESGIKGYQRAQLNRLLEKYSKGKDVLPMSIALLYADLGEKDKAIEWLQEEFNKRPDHIVYINVEPRFDSLHNDPRFNNLLLRIGLLP